VEGVSAMPEAVKSRPRLTLNSDGEPHPVENALTIFTFVAGLVVFAIGFVVSLHAIGTVLGLVVFLVGLYAQMVSNTREQRVTVVEMGSDADHAPEPSLACRRKPLSRSRRARCSGPAPRTRQ